MVRPVTGVQPAEEQRAEENAKPQLSFLRASKTPQARWNNRNSAFEFQFLIILNNDE
jgi:hypothetical protein